jgi:hypothetical protein
MYDHENEQCDNWRGPALAKVVSAVLNEKDRLKAHQ